MTKSKKVKLLWNRIFVYFLCFLIFIPLDFDAFYYQRIYYRPWINDIDSHNSTKYFFFLVEENFTDEDEQEKTTQKSMLAKEEEIRPTIRMKELSSDSLSKKIIQTGHYLIGRPYVLGAFPLQSKLMDCSSFIQYVFFRNGIDIPRLAIDQTKIGEVIDKKDLEVGDIVFFSDINGNICHSALYVGNDVLLHTYNHIGVTYSNINSRWWSAHYVTARRVIG